MNIIRNTFFFCAFSLSLSLFAGVSVGSWRDHLPYNSGVYITEANDRIYCATRGGALFYYDLSNNTYNENRISKANMLNDLGISAIKYSATYQTLIIAYNNANIDLLFGNKTVINISDIKNKQLYGNKSINDILLVNQYAYLSTAFGVVVLDLEKKELKEQYYFEENAKQIYVYKVITDGSTLYAATDKGIYSAPLNGSNLMDFSNWQPITNIPFSTMAFSSICFFNGKLYAAYSNPSGIDRLYVNNGGSWTEINASRYTKIYHLEPAYNYMVVTDAMILDVYNSEEEIIQSLTDTYDRFVHAVIDKNLTVWIAEYYMGLVRLFLNGETERYTPNSPAGSFVADISSAGEDVWVAGGSKEIVYNYGLGDGVFSLINDRWTNFPDIRNIFTIKASPNDPGRVFAGSIGKGLLEFKNNNFVRLYNQTNGSIRSIMNLGDEFVRVLGMDFDPDDNLWFTVSQTKDPLYVLDTEGTIHNIAFNTNIFSSEERVFDVLVTNSRHKWIIGTRAYNGLYAFDDAGTWNISTDDRQKYFEIENQDYKKLGAPLSIAKDLEGNIWVGTAEGPVVYYSPDAVFDTEPFLGHQIILSRNDQTGLADYMLGTEAIMSIAVDGSNRKWFGTASSGAYLMSADGTKEILHFTADNSPLLSNYVLAINVNPSSGEVFFGTDKGIISYRGDASIANDDFTNVYVFPNPVRENYRGVITITGLVMNTIVKITDISGNLLYETKSNGGQATWNGKNFSGRRPQTGVYLVFLSNKDGSKTHITKLLFIN